MELTKVTDRVWYYPFEKERDRPILGYVKGDEWSFAVDAGHSRQHTLEFYSALEKAGLPLPYVTVLTHWHWDHSFGLHAIKGKCISNARTRDHLIEFKKLIADQGVEDFLSMDEGIRNEYSDLKNNPVSIARSKYNNTVVISDIERYFDKVVNIVIMVDNLKEVTTKNNQKMAFINGSDELSSISVVLFPKNYEKYNISKNDIIYVTGRVEKRFDKYQLIASNIEKIIY